MNPLVSLQFKSDVLQLSIDAGNWASQERGGGVFGRHEQRRGASDVQGTGAAEASTNIP